MPNPFGFKVALPIKKVAKTGRKKKQAFGVARTAAIKAKSHHNATASILSKLPAEVREQIWRYVLGDKVLHIFRARFPASNVTIYRWRTAVCTKEHDLSQMHVCSKTPQPLHVINQQMQDAGLTGSQIGAAKFTAEMHGHFAELCYEWQCKKYHHQTCRDEAARYWPSIQSLTNPPTHQTVPWRRIVLLLSTCRLVYHEAINVLYKTNTFSFNRPKDMADFLSNRTTLQTQLLAKLHLEITVFDTKTLQAWSSGALSMKNIRALTGLKELHIFIVETFAHAHLDQTLVPRMRERTAEMLLKFKAAPLLETARVIMYGGAFSPFAVTAMPLRFQECQAWARDVERRLLE